MKKLLSLLLLCALTISCSSDNKNMIFIPPIGPGNKTVCFFGNSITFGSADPALNGFRKKLDDLLTADRLAGSIPPTLTFTYVGPHASGDPPTDHHDAVSGATAQDLLNALPGQFGVGTPIPALDLAIVQIGGTETTIDSETTTFPSDYLSLIRQINALTGCVRFVGQIFPIPTTVTPHVADNTRQINSQFPELWNTLESVNGLYIGRANIQAVLPNSDVHPDPAGFTIWANALHAPTRAALGYPITP